MKKKLYFVIMLLFSIIPISSIKAQDIQPQTNINVNIQKTMDGKKNENTEKEPIATLVHTQNKKIHFFLDHVTYLLVNFRMTFFAKIKRFHIGLERLWSARFYIMEICIEYFYNLFYFHILCLSVLFLYWLCMLWFMRSRFFYQRISKLLHKILNTPYVPTVIVVIMSFFILISYGLYYTGLAILNFIYPIEAFLLGNESVHFIPHGWKIWNESCFLFGLLTYTQLIKRILPMYLSPLIKSKEWITLVEFLPDCISRASLIFYFLFVFINSSKGTLTEFGIQATLDLGFIITSFWIGASLLSIENKVATPNIEEEEKQKIANPIEETKTLFDETQTPPSFFIDSANPISAARIVLISILMMWLFFTESFHLLLVFMFYFLMFVFFGPFVLSFISAVCIEIFKFFSINFLINMMHLSSKKSHNIQERFYSIYNNTLLFFSILFSLYISKIHLIILNYIPEEVIQRILEKVMDITGIVFLCYVAMYFVSYFYRLLEFYLLSSISEELYNSRKTFLSILFVVVRITCFIIIGFIILMMMGFDVLPLLSNFNLIAFGFGLGFQHTIRDVISGVTMMFENTVAIGDQITVDGLHGIVEEFSFRKLRIRQEDGTLISLNLGPIVNLKNHSRKYSYVILNIYVDNNMSIEQLRLLLNKAYQRLIKQTPINNYILGIVEFDGIKEVTHIGMIARARIKTKANTQNHVHMAFNAHFKKILEEDSVSMPVPTGSLLVSLTSAKVSFE